MSTSRTNPSNPDWVKIVRQHIEPLNYGSVEIVVHDSRIVQIDKTQRWRLPKTSPSERPEIPAAARSNPRIALK